MAVFKCKMCGGNLEASDAATVATCEYCGTRQTLPRVDDESIANLFNRANRLRIHCEFDKAEEVYEKIINLDDTESEAHWGMLLCKYGIEYVEDPATFERIPTCHRASYLAVTEDDDYIAAVENADAVRKELYISEAKRIEELQKNILAKTKEEKPFDVFICYKESDESGERTPDSVLAEDIYDALTVKGFRVFFSRITLEDKLGQEYEPYIFSALNSAKAMLVVGTKPEYIEAVWVRNEWSRYIKLLKNDRSKVLIPVYKDMDPYDMPEAFSHMQAQNMAKVGAIQDLVRGVGKIVNADSNETVASQSFLANQNSELLDNAFSLLQDLNFKTAEKNFDKVLVNNPENAMAYIGKLMAELKITEFNVKGFAGKKYKKKENYLKALEYADENLKEKLEGIENFYNERSRKIKKLITITAISIFTPILLCVLIFFGAYFVALANYNSESPNYESLRMTFGIMDDITSDVIKWDSLNHKIIQMRTHCNLATGKVAESHPEIEELEVTVKKTMDSLRYFPNLKKLTVVAPITSIERSMFENCNSLLKNLTEITLPNTVTTIGGHAFSDFESLTAIPLPDSVVKIEEFAFMNCSSLKQMKLPSNLEYIGGYAFWYCENLESVVIPKSVSEIKSLVFGGCQNLKTVYCEAESMPEGWADDWISNSGTKVVWGYKGE